MMILSFFGMARVNYLNAQNVAKVGETEYASIEEAIANWTNNTTLTLLQNVELTDVIILKSTEYHVLDLGSYIMTAASGKDAIQIENCGRASAGVALDIKADLNNTGGITATGKAVVRTSGKSGVKDRPIIRFYDGVFNASYVAYHSGSNGTNCPQFYFFNGVFNGTVYTNRTLNIFSGGTFNGSLMMSVDSSAYTLIKAGRFKELSNLYMSALNNAKFTIGTSKGQYDVGIYVDDEGYYVVGGTVITEAGDNHQASIKKSFGTNDYLKYSSAAEYGLYYTDALVCLTNNNSTSSVVNIYTDQLNLRELNYKGTINISNTLAVTFNEGTTPAWTVTADGYEVSYTDVVANGKVTRTYVPAIPVAQLGETQYYALADALNAVESSDDVITILKDTKGPGLVIDKDVTIDFNGKTYSFTEGVGSTGTESNGFQILQGNTVVLKNGGLNVAESAKENFYILVQNYADLTIEDMNLDGTNLDKCSATDGDSYVLSNNSGNVSITGKTIIKANDQGDKAFAFDACKYASYDAPVVTLGENVTVDGKVELTGGQLYHNTENINAVVGKSFEGNANVWGTISVPMVGGAAIPVATAGTHDLYRYDEVEQEWEYYTDADGPGYTKLDMGRGYLYTNTADIDLQLSGVLNVNDVEFELSYTEGNILAGFNMIGNPFAHNIDDSHFSTNNGAVLANGFYIINSDGQLQARPVNTIIAPMEAVLVKSDKAGMLTMLKESNGQVSKSNRETPAYLAVNVANKTYSDVAYVSFNEGLGLDKIPHRNAEIPMVYIPVDGINYAIATMSNDVTEIPVSFKAATIGEYTIGAEAQGCDYLTMTLVDRLTGIETNLMLENYTFIATSNDSEERFFIRLGNSQQSTDNSHFAYITNGMISIDHIEGHGMLNIYDIIGRPVAEYNVATSANISTADFAAGVYIIRISDENGVKVQKIVVE